MSDTKNSVPRVVILAGGLGRRLEPYTNVLPKPLMPVGHSPILEILLRQLKTYDLTDITLAVGYLASLIQAFVGDGSHFGLNIEYSFEHQPLGTVGPLTLVPNLDSTFMIMNGDLLTSLNFQSLIDFHRASKAIATVATYERHIQISLGVIETDSEQNIISYVEKPSYHFQVSMGISVLEPQVFKYIPQDTRFDMPELICRLIDAQEKVVAYPFQDGYWLDIGRPEDYRKAIDDLDELARVIPGFPVDPTEGS
jgi:NDP-mannose synthase